MNTLEVIQAGRVPYSAALEQQRQLADDRIAGRLPHDVLLLLEHPPVYTKGRRAKWEEAELAKYAKAGKPPPANWRTRYKEPGAPDTSDLLGLPEGWCWASACLARRSWAQR